MDIRYAAGFIDGEGCIQIYKQDNKFGIRLSVYQTNPIPLYDLVDLFSGSISYREPKVANRKPLYTWNVFSNDAYIALKALYPFLIVKKEECLMAMEYFENRKNKKLALELYAKVRAAKKIEFKGALL